MLKPVKGCNIGRKMDISLENMAPLASNACKRQCNRVREEQRESDDYSRFPSQRRAHVKLSNWDIEKEHTAT